YGKNSTGRTNIGTCTSPGGYRDRRRDLVGASPTSRAVPACRTSRYGRQWPHRRLLDISGLIAVAAAELGCSAPHRILSSCKGKVMAPTVLRTRAAVALSLAGAVTGWLITAAAVPYLRQVDPLGLSPVVLISAAGRYALGWYLRGRAEQGAAPDSVRNSASGT